MFLCRNCSTNCHLMFSVEIFQWKCNRNKRQWNTNPTYPNKTFPDNDCCRHTLAFLFLSPWFCLLIVSVQNHSIWQQVHFHLLSRESFPIWCPCEWIRFYINIPVNLWCLCRFSASFGMWMDLFRLKSIYWQNCSLVFVCIAQNVNIFDLLDVFLMILFF